MKRLFNTYNNSNTLTQYLINGIKIRLFYLFGRDFFHKQVKLFKIDTWLKIKTAKETPIDYLVEDFIAIVRNSEIALLTINHTDYSNADDIIDWYRGIDPTGSLLFIPDWDTIESLGHDGENVKKLTYDVKLFLAGQASAKRNSLTKRLYYSKLLKELTENKIRNGSFQKDLIKVFLSLYFLSLRDTFRLSQLALSGKIKNLSPKISEYSSPDYRDVNNSVEVIPGKWRNVIITGWYGTETNGDKAILGELIHFIKSSSPHCEITITSICPLISHQTNLEIKGLADARIIELKESDNPSLIEMMDCVIFGGGPLMESSSLLQILSLFGEANRQKKSRVIFGCGIGPIHTDKSRAIITRILELTSKGFLRDEESFKYANRLYPENRLKWACDPAFGYIDRWRRNNKLSTADKRQLRIAGLLRANTREFQNDLNYLALSEANDKAAVQIAEIVQPVCISYNALFDLLHMNAPWIGGDDRLFNKKVEGSFRDESHVNCIREYLTLEEHLQRLSIADVSLAMRYHGHIFSMAMGIPFLSINYTGKEGKIESLVNRIGYNEWSVSWTELNVEKASQQLQKLIEERKNISFMLLEKTNILIDLLYSTYWDVFGIKINRHT